MCFPALSLFFPYQCYWFIKKFRTLRHGLSNITCVSNIPLKELCANLCDMYPSACRTFSSEDILDPSQSLHTDLHKCCSYTKTRPIFCSIPFGINTYWNSVGSYGARILTNREHILADLLHIHSGIANVCCMLCFF